MQARDLIDEMYSPETIRSMSRDAAEKAVKERHEPFMVEQEDVEEWSAALASGRTPRLPFPNLGDYRPKGWDLADHWLVDATGMGSESEPALTARQLLQKLKPGFGYGIVETGQFQVVVAEFRRKAPRRKAVPPLPKDTPAAPAVPPAEESATALVANLIG